MFRNRRRKRRVRLDRTVKSRRKSPKSLVDLALQLRLKFRCLLPHTGQGRLHILLDLSLETLFEFFAIHKISPPWVNNAEVFIKAGGLGRKVNQRDVAIRHKSPTM